jgi:hypothetical protein
MNHTSCNLLGRGSTKSDESLLRKRRSTRSVWTTATRHTLIIELWSHIGHSGLVLEARGSSMELAQNISIVFFAEAS